MVKKDSQTPNQKRGLGFAPLKPAESKNTPKKHSNLKSKKALKSADSKT